MTETAVKDLGSPETRALKRTIPDFINSHYGEYSYHVRFEMARAIREWIDHTAQKPTKGEGT